MYRLNLFLHRKIGNIYVLSLNYYSFDRVQLPPKTTEVNISAVGSGFAIIQVSTAYNLNVTGEWPLFTLDPQLVKNANQNRMILTICSR